MTADWAIMLEACLRHDEAPALNNAAPAERSPKGDSVSEPKSNSATQMS